MRTSSLLLTAFVAGVPGLSAFTCTWRGGDYSWYTYYEDFPPYCCAGGTDCSGTGYGYFYMCGDNYYESCFSCNGGAGYCCDDPYSKQYMRETKTQCCQCAGDIVYSPFTRDDEVLTSYDCNAAAVDVNDPYPNTLGEIQGCDGFSPEIDFTAAASQVRAPGEWFTSAAQLDAYLQQSISCSDDCWEMAAAQNSASTAGTQYCRYTWTADCDNTLVSVEAKDRCGNAATTSFRVRYDPDPPVVSVTLGAFAPTKYKTHYETLPLTVTVSDTCDPNPQVSIEVFSDEAPLLPELEPSAVLGRTYDYQTINAPLTGWTLTVNRKYASKTGAINKRFVAEITDGRVYTVRVCAMDLAGNFACDEATSGVPVKDVTSHMPVPGTNSGKLYKMASDLVYWNQPQNDIPFRLQNTGLNL